MSFPSVRLRRFRKNETWRRAVRETSLSVDDFVYPLFVVAGEGVRHPVASMPGVFQLSVDLIVEEAREVQALGIPGVILFGVPDDGDKDAEGSAGYDPDGLVPTAVRAIKEAVPDLLVWADVCLCEYATCPVGAFNCSPRMGRWTATRAFPFWPGPRWRTQRRAPTPWPPAT